MMVQVLRSISGLNARPGDLVDASDWAPNRVHMLTKQRRILPVALVGEKKGRPDAQALGR